MPEWFMYIQALAVFFAPPALLITWSLACLKHARRLTRKRALFLIITTLLIFLLTIAAGALGASAGPFGAGVLAAIAWTSLTTWTLTAVTGSSQVAFSTIAAGVGAFVVIAPTLDPRCPSAIAVALLALAILTWQVIAFLGFARWAIIIRTADRVRCYECDYDLSNINTYTCPECGATCKARTDPLRSPHRGRHL